jgi:N-acetylated-alpha-linked acidic dipeptidase
LVYCAWDGEEPSLLGSTEWVESNQEELRKKAVTYINSDGNSRGFIGAAGTHSFEPWFNEAISTIKDPQTGVSIRERRYAKMMSDADRTTRAKMLGNSYMKLSALGAGSDYSPFLQFLGISSLNIGFGGEGDGGEYHSIYDNYDHFTKFKDPGFAYGATLSKTCARLVLRLANADVLPFNFNAFHATVADYVQEIKSMTDQMRTDAEMEKKLLNNNLYKLAEDPTEKLRPKIFKGDVPFLDFSPLDNNLVVLKQRADEFASMSAKAFKLSEKKRQQLNAILFKAERSLINDEGLPRRKWYKHQIYAPGYYTGYGVKTLPGIREGVEEKSWKEAQANIYIVAASIAKYTSQVELAIGLLK